MSPVIHKSFATKVAEVASVVIEPLIPPIVENYLEENPPIGGLTIEQIKADTDIADLLSKKHASGSDNQDLSGKMDITAFTGFAKITVGSIPPTNPGLNDIWIDTN